MKSVNDVKTPLCLKVSVLNTLMIFIQETIRMIKASEVCLRFSSEMF